MTDHVYEALDGLRRHHEKHARAVAGEVLLALAFALYVAAAVLLALMVLLWSMSGQDGYEPDFPGRYWLADLPMLAAAIVLNLMAFTVRDGR